MPVWWGWVTDPHNNRGNMMEKVNKEILYELLRVLIDRLIAQLSDTTKPIRASLLSECRKLLSDNDIKVSNHFVLDGFKEITALPFKPTMEDISEQMQDSEL